MVDYILSPEVWTEHFIEILYTEFGVSLLPFTEYSLNRTPVAADAAITRTHEFAVPPMRQGGILHKLSVLGSICPESGIAEPFLKLYAALAYANHSKLR